MSRCAINFCTREPGIGTHVRIRVNESQEIMAAICDPHWEAIRAVAYPEQEKA